jgi:hypothetical protein
MIKQDLTCFKRLVQRTRLLKIKHKDNKKSKKIICNNVELLGSKEKDNKNKETVIIEILNEIKKLN